MAGLIARFGRLRVTAEPREPYEALCESVIYQQLHAKAAAAITARFVAQIGDGAFPAPQMILAASDEALRSVGLSGNKTAALRDLARHAADARLPSLAACDALDDETLIARFCEIRGVGRWTAEMFLIFTLGRPDVLPSGDLGVRRGYQNAFVKPALPTPRELTQAGKPWAPFRTLATLYLWRAASPS